MLSGLTTPCLALGLVLLLAAPSVSTAASPGLADGGEAEVVSVVDGDTLSLSDGRRVRLVGIQAPKLSLGRSYVRKQPYADRSKAALEAMTLGKRIKLSYGGQRMDRYERQLAHLHTASGTWIQGELLKRGLARVYSFRDNRALVDRMLELEASARRAGRGLWSLDYYRVRTPEETYRLVDTFQLVRGRVISAARVKGRVYLNFGEDWKRDFTVTISRRDLRAFTKAGLDPLSWQGRQIRVRGWLNWRNGPMIDATHPEQIEVLGE